MHSKFRRANELSHEAIGAAIEVHRLLGPGLLESVYESCLEYELGLRGIRQEFINVVYKDFVQQHELKFDLLLEDCLLLELKACTEIPKIFKAKLMIYMKLMDVPVGLLINFHCEQLKQGIHRLILKGADSLAMVKDV
jgi:GxxExxY protein